MITLTSAQIDTWIAALFYPLTRILAVVATAPLWSSAGVPRRVRLLLGLAITIGIMPVLPAMPAVPPGSGLGLAIMGQQILIGVGMGFAMRVVFAAVEVAGEYMGLQMGLGFATFYDPLTTSQTPVTSEFVNLLALLVFIALNGPLLFVATLAQSFAAIPVSTAPLAAGSWKNLVELGSTMFSAGLLLSLPVLVTLIIANIALAVLTRAAPQLNIFAVGFPLTLIAGLVAMGAGLAYLGAPLQALFDQGIRAMLEFALPGGG